MLTLLPTLTLYTLLLTVTFASFHIDLSHANSQEFMQTETCIQMKVITEEGEGEEKKENKEEKRLISLQDHLHVQCVNCIYMYVLNIVYIF